MFENDNYKFIKLLWTSFTKVSNKDYSETVKILLEQEGIDINVKDI